jgi:hypothetical protein
MILAFSVGQVSDLLVVNFFLHIEVHKIIALGLLDSFWFTFLHVLYTIGAAMVVHFL